MTRETASWQTGQVGVIPALVVRSVKVLSATLSNLPNTEVGKSKSRKWEAESRVKETERKLHVALTGAMWNVYGLWKMHNAGINQRKAKIDLCITDLSCNFTEICVL